MWRVGLVVLGFFGYGGSGLAVLHSLFGFGGWIGWMRNSVSDKRIVGGKRVEHKYAEIQIGQVSKLASRAVRN